MRRRLLGGVSMLTLATCLVVSACGFAVSGSADSNATASGGGAPSSSSSSSSGGSSSNGSSGATSSSSSSSSGGGESDASADAVDSGCNPIVVDDPLNAAVNTNLWVKANNDAAADYPKLETNAMGTKAMTALIPLFGGAKRGGMWLKQRMPTRSFTVTFEYLVRCQGTCADGIAFSWTNPTNEAGLNTGGIGNGLGVPDAPGGAFSITYIKDFDGSGGTTKPPTLALHQLTTGMPGATQSSQSSDDLVRQLRTVTIRYRKGTASFTTPGSNSSGQAPGNFLGYVGFSAGSGSASQAVFVSSFHGEFADCDLP